MREAHQNARRTLFGRRPRALPASGCKESRSFGAVGPKPLPHTQKKRLRNLSTRSPTLIVFPTIRRSMVSFGSRLISAPSTGITLREFLFPSVSKFKRPATIRIYPNTTQEVETSSLCHCRKHLSDSVRKEGFLLPVAMENICVRCTAKGLCRGAHTTFSAQKYGNNRFQARKKRLRNQSTRSPTLIVFPTIRRSMVSFGSRLISAPSTGITLREFDFPSVSNYLRPATIRTCPNIPPEVGVCSLRHSRTHLSDRVRKEGFASSVAIKNICVRFRVKRPPAGRTRPTFSAPRRKKCPAIRISPGQPSLCF